MIDNHPHQLSLWAECDAPRRSTLNRANRQMGRYHIAMMRQQISEYRQARDEALDAATALRAA